MKKAIANYLVNFNDYWVKNMYSQIQITTSLKDTDTTI
jgi:hypothetical protein